MDIENITDEEIKEIETVEQAGDKILDEATLQDLVSTWLARYEDELDEMADIVNAEVLASLEDEEEQ